MSNLSDKRLLRIKKLAMSEPAETDHIRREHLTRIRELYLALEAINSVSYEPLLQVDTLDGARACIADTIRLLSLQIG